MDDLGSEHADAVIYVRCTVCGLEIEEAEAQAQRWGYWQVAVDLYPFCPECAVREFAPLGSPPRE